MSSRPASISSTPSLLLITSNPNGELIRRILELSNKMANPVVIETTSFHDVGRLDETHWTAVLLILSSENSGEPSFWEKCSNRQNTDPRVIPIWSASEPIPEPWCKLSCIRAVALNDEDLLKEIEISLGTKNTTERGLPLRRKKEHAGKPPKKLTIMGERMSLTFQSAPWPNIGKIIAFFLASGFLFFMSEKSSGFEHHGYFTLGIFTTALSLWIYFNLWFPQTFCKLTRSWFVVRSRIWKNRPFTPARGWVAIPTRRISHFDGRSPNKLIVHRFSQSGSESFRAETFDLPIYFDAALIAKALNGQLEEYRPPPCTFISTGSYDPRSERSTRFRVAWKMFKKIIRVECGPLVLAKLFREWKKRDLFSRILLIGNLILPLGLVSFLAAVGLAALHGADIPFWILLGATPLFSIVRLLWIPRGIDSASRALVRLEEEKTNEFIDAPTMLLSYSHKDRGFIYSLVAALQRAQVRVWIDRLEIRPGDQWLKRVEEGISSHEWLCVVLSRHSISSQFVEEELRVASGIKGDGFPLLPILLDDVPIPAFIDRYEMVDLRDKRIDAHRVHHILAVISKEVRRETNESTVTDGASLVSLRHTTPLTCLRPSSTDDLHIYPSPLWHLISTIFALLLFGATFAFSASSQSVTELQNSSAPDDKLFLALLIRIGLMAVPAILLMYHSVRLAVPRIWAHMDHRDLRLSMHGSGLSIDDISYYSQDGASIVVHVRPTFGRSTIRFRAYPLIGRIPTLVMTLNGHLAAVRKLEYAHDVIGESRLHLPAFAPFPGKSWTRIKGGHADTVRDRQVPELRMSPTWYLVPAMISAIAVGSALHDGFSAGIESGLFAAIIVVLCCLVARSLYAAVAFGASYSRLGSQIFIGVILCIGFATQCGESALGRRELGKYLRALRTHESGPKALFVRGVVDFDENFTVLRLIDADGDVHTIGGAMTMTDLLFALGPPKLEFRPTSRHATFRYPALGLTFEYHEGSLETAEIVSLDLPGAITWFIADRSIRTLDLFIMEGAAKMLEGLPDAHVWLMTDGLELARCRHPKRRLWGDECDSVEIHSERAGPAVVEVYFSKPVVRQ